MAPISEGECILCGRWPEKDRWALRDAIEILPWEDDGVCDACFAMTILHHPHGSDEWIVSEDNDKEIKLRASELTSYRRFHMHAIQAWRLYPLMTDEEWNVILAKALHEAQISATFLQCRYRR